MLHDLRYAARMLRNSPGFTLLAVAALALGIGANCAIFAVVNALLLAPLPYADPNHLYEIGSIDDKGRITGTSIASFEALQNHNTAFAHLSTDRFWSFTLTDSRNDAERVYGRGLSADTFATLGVAPQIGRGFLADDFRVAVLSHRLWQRRYSADPHIIGAQIQLDGESYTVVGVMPAQFQFPIPVYDLYVPWIPTAAELANRRDHGSIVYARLRPGVSLAHAQAELDSFAAATATQFSDTEKDWHPHLGPTKLGSADQYRTQLLVLLGAVGFVLLIACLNVANLLLARAASRRREIAIRIALGAARARIIRQLLTESLLLAAMGAAAGLVLANWTARLLMSSFPVRAPRPHLEYAGMNVYVFGFTLILTAIAGIGFGLVPALQLSRPDLNETLKQSGRNASGRWRGILIVAETALSLILLAGAGLMLRSFSRLIDVQPGFHAENVLTIQVPMPSFTTVAAPRKEVEARQTAEYRDLVDRLRLLPGVTASAMSTLLPLGNIEVHTQIGYAGDPNPAQDHGAQLRSVSPDYFRAMGIALIEGRVFTDSDVDGSPRVAIINDAVMHRYWPNESPLGKQVNMSGKPTGPWDEVVGVVASVRHKNLKDEPEPEMYLPYQQYLGPAFGAALIVRGVSNPTPLAPAIRQQIRTLYPNQPIGDIKLLTDIVAESVAAPKFYAVLLAAFALLALSLASAGIYGVMAYAVAQRTREVGIRMALGATRGSVLHLVLTQGLRWVLVGVAIGVAGAIALARFIQSQLYSTTPTDPVTLTAVSLILLLSATAAGYFPAARAARVDPNIVLRNE